MAVCIGIDLAWSDQRPSAGCAVGPGGDVVAEAALASDGEVVAWIDALANRPTVVGIDAPLQVPNTTGRRPSEADVAAVYGGRHAGPHPSNRSLLVGRDGRIRGEHLAAALAQRGFGGPWSAGPDFLLEVFPHPTLVEAFGLPERLAYKKGSVDERRRGLRRLRNLLALLEDGDPPLRGSHIPIPHTARGRALKAIEDRLDARVCAWAALVWQLHGRDRVHLFGDSAAGHIAVPQGVAIPDPSVVRAHTSRTKA